MKVKDTLNIDLVHSTLPQKLLNFLHGETRYSSDWEAIQFVKKNFPQWQYNGVDKFDNVLMWCQKHLGDNFIWNWEIIYFKTEKDKLVFLLRWA